MSPFPELYSYRKHWAQRFGTAPFLPMSREEMDTLGWDSCDVIIVTGDAYVDHPSFGMALIGRVLEAQGFRVGIIAQPDWRDPEAFRALGRPRRGFSRGHEPHPDPADRAGRENSGPAACSFCRRSLPRMA